MDLMETRIWGVDRIHVAQDRHHLEAFVNMVMKLQIP
jgi:hypothetical protein